MRILRPALSNLLLISVAACASAGLNAADSVTRLEQQQKSSPSSAGANRQLGIAYYEAKRYPEARGALETAARLDPRDGTTSLYLGLTDEELNDLPAAKTAYSSYITFGRTSRVRSQLQSRLAALTRKEIVNDAKTAVAQERSLAGQAGDPRTVAVLPLSFTGADTSLKPLERGLADLLTTDLSRSAQLTLVERSRMQALVDEIKLQQTGATDASTNVRAGKLIKAGRVVQGTILQVDPTNVNVTTGVVNVSTSQVQGTAQSANQLEQIFTLEKDLALKLFTELGVTLTPAERNAIEQRPTRSLAAFIAYSNGLKAGDEGRYDDASRFFNEAVRIDPGFSAAQSKGQEAKAISAGTQVTAATVETSLKGSSEGATVNAAKNGSSTVNTGLGNSAQTAAADLNPSPSGAATGSASASGGAGAASAPGQVDPASAGTGSDNPTGTAKVTIVITRPKTP
jgi:tetratricopeptide (TPR) repeat protein